MIEIRLTEVQFSVLVKMLCTSTYRDAFYFQINLVNFIRGLNPDLFDKSYPFPAAL